MVQANQRIPTVHAGGDLCIRAIFELERVEPVKNVY
jgi:hypothetical protein